MATAPTLALPAASPPSAQTTPPPLPSTISSTSNSALAPLPLKALDHAALERARIRAILEAPEAQGREGLARYLALQTDNSSDAARAILKEAPVAAASAPHPNAFEQAMAGIPNPVVGVGIIGREDEQSADAEAARILQWIKKAS